MQKESDKEFLSDLFSTKLKLSTLLIGRTPHLSPKTSLQTF